MTSWRRSHELFGRGGVDQNPKTEPVDIAAEVGHGHAAGDQDRGGGDQGPVRGVTDQDRGATAGGGETRGRRGDGQSQGPSHMREVCFDSHFSILKAQRCKIQSI